MTFSFLRFCSKAQVTQLILEIVFVFLFRNKNSAIGWYFRGFFYRRFGCEYCVSERRDREPLETRGGIFLSEFQKRRSYATGE
jgi:hypothetical protein